MNPKQIEEVQRISVLEQDYCEQIIEQKQRMSKEGKRFYTCSIAGYQLIIIGTTDGRWVHTFIPTIEFIKQITEKDMGETF